MDAVRTRGRPLDGLAPLLQRCLSVGFEQLGGGEAGGQFRGFNRGRRAAPTRSQRSARRSRRSQWTASSGWSLTSVLPQTNPTGRPRRSSPRAALLRIPPLRRARRIWSSASLIAPFETATYYPRTALDVLIQYPHHPRAGERVAVVRRLQHGGRSHFVIEQPDGTRALLPAWMTEPWAAQLPVVKLPRLTLEALFTLRD